jgi:hypothetical protein
MNSYEILILILIFQKYLNYLLDVEESKRLFSQK